MSDEYSKANWPELRLFKKQFSKGKSNNPHVDPLDFFIGGMNENITAYQNEFGDNGMQFFVADYFARFLFVEKEYSTFFFKDEELIDFLINTKSKITFKDLFEILKLKNNTIKFLSGSSQYYFHGIINCKSFKDSLFFNIFTSDDFLIIYAVGGLCETTLLSVPLKFVDYNENFDIKKYVEKNHSQNTNVLKLILNFMFYIDAFPENVLNRPPDEVLDKLNKDNSKTISLSKDIADYLHENRDVSPHLRRGHFRYLASDRFKNKQFQTVFVKSSFVKGEAKTIIGEKQ